MVTPLDVIVCDPLPFMVYMPDPDEVTIPVASVRLPPIVQTSPVFVQDPANPVKSRLPVSTAGDVLKVNTAAPVPVDIFRL